MLCWEEEEEGETLQIFIYVRRSETVGHGRDAQEVYLLVDFRGGQNPMFLSILSSVIPRVCIFGGVTPTKRREYTLRRQKSVKNTSFCE